MSDTRLGQIVYGRGKDGYGVLGTSPAGRPIIGAVAALCRAVGSPDRPGEIPTFLLSKRDGDSAIMIRACRGAPDPTGRATIFFHALVADADLLRSVGLDAFALEKVGAFAESCPGREPPDLPFPNSRQQAVAPTEPRSVDLPATISSYRPLAALVRRELGPESLDRNWATFSFNPLPKFDLCVLSAYSPRKGEGTQYSFDGAGLHLLSLGKTAAKPGGARSRTCGGVAFKKPSLPLLLSLVANAILAIVLLVRDADRPVETLVAAVMTEAEARTKWENQWKAEWEACLPPPSPPMTESEARAKWEARWKDEWRKSLPPMPSASKMTEDEAKAKWETKWKAHWEESLPKMEKEEAKQKWNLKEEGEWKGTFRADFEAKLKESGGVWPIGFNDNDSPFLKSIRDLESKPNGDDKLAVKWQVYRSCKACADFIESCFGPVSSIQQ